jgi:UrcA family protein
MTTQRDTRNQHWEIAMKNLTTLIAVAGFTVLCATAQAADMSGAPAEVVRFASSDAAHAATVAKLYRRIDAAAGRVCGQRLAPGTPFVSKSWRLCVQGAMRNALAQINSPAVSDYAAAHGVVVNETTVARN